MTEPIKIYGCLTCDKEYKDDKEALEHYNEFKAKGDTTHVTVLKKLIGVPMKPITKKPEFVNIDSDSLKKD